MKEIWQDKVVGNGGKDFMEWIMEK